MPPTSVPKVDDLGQIFDKIIGLHDSLIGMVVDVMLPPKQTISGEFMRTFTITDASLAKRNLPSGGLKVRVFCKEHYQLPQVRSVGDVVLMRNVIGKTFNGQPVILNDKVRTSYAVFSSYDIPAVVPRLSAYGQNDPTSDICLSTCYWNSDKNWTPSREEQIRAIVTKRDTELVRAARLKSAPADTNLAFKPNTSVPLQVSERQVEKRPTIQDQSYRPNKKEILIKDANINQFCDVLVEVVKIFPLNQDYGDCEIYITDYTGNDLLFSWPAPEEKDDGLYGQDGDQFGYMAVTKREWPGPYGSLTLRVEVQEPHASVIRNAVKEGDVIAVQNMRIKMSRLNKMEGNLWRDRVYPDKIYIRPKPSKNDERYASLMKRKEKYWAGRKHIKAADEQPEKPLSKGQKRKLKLKQKRENAAAVGGHPQTKKPKTDHEASVTSNLNKHIRCYPLDGDKSTPLSDILAFDCNSTATNDQHVSEEHEKTWKATVRVLDFFPSKLEDFTTLKEEIGGDPIDVEYLSQNWQWDFFLLVEDSTPSENATGESKTQLWLKVEHADAEHLLQQDATDLKSSHKDVLMLREKLAVLWGNLGERKMEAQENDSPYTPSGPTASELRVKQADAGLSNLPFACCIRAFNRKLDEGNTVLGSTDYITCYGMFGTTIT